MKLHQQISLGDEFFDAMQSRTTVDPVTSRFEDITVDEAYRISERFLQRRLEDGETVIGRKIGLTSDVVQKQLGVDQPDFGTLTDAMQYGHDSIVPISRSLIQPKAEGEIAFVLKADLAGPGICENDVLHATDYVIPCIEIVDSRVRNWAIKLQDTVADNASCGLFVLGEAKADPMSMDLTACEMTIETDGEVVATGTGAAVMGNPLKCVAWLANVMSEYGITLRAGNVILAGSLGPFVDSIPGSTMLVSISGIGSVSARFS